MYHLDFEGDKSQHRSGSKDGLLSCTLTESAQAYRQANKAKTSSLMDHFRAKGLSFRSASLPILCSLNRVPDNLDPGNFVGDGEISLEIFHKKRFD